MKLSFSQEWWQVPSELFRVVKVILATGKQGLWSPLIALDQFPRNFQRKWDGVLSSGILASLFASSTVA